MNIHIIFVNDKQQECGQSKAVDNLKSLYIDSRFDCKILWSARFSSNKVKITVPFITRTDTQPTRTGGPELEFGCI